MYLAQNLKYLRTKAGEKQKDIAELLGVSEMTVSRYESGENEPELIKVLKISKHYELTMDELVAVQLQEELPLYVKNIRFLRKRNDFTQSEMAELLGYKGKQGYGAFETGNSAISVENLIKLADYFGVTLDKLVKQDLSNGGA